jgi:hypothetical protein
MWVTAADATFNHWLVRPQTSAFSPVVYEGTKLVGCLFSVPYSLRIGSSVHDQITFGSPSTPSLGVCVAARRTASSAQRRARNFICPRHGVNDPTSPSIGSDKIRQRFPEPEFLFPLTIGPGITAAAGASGHCWERLTINAGPAAPLTPHRHDPRASYQRRTTTVHKILTRLSGFD